ncbi:MAG: putative metal-dependent hydrolase YcfH [Alphaproteobacteria bacterium MarineAlpha11_Bin1]|nr:MAG: putative metal-dependent hydrolase YcfH [Alphaproteobacteria bacterium MarineAlpha11_Bin1]|tara:strand:- start:6185 stop:6973 length:789 start_codon:yes stop_codon:yes gene_type:complete
MLVDSHCHLDFDVFDEDRADTIRRAKDAGIGTMVTICTRVTRFAQILNIAESDPNIWCSVGIHPHQADEEPLLSTEDLVSRAQNPKVVGIGETGLDYYYDNSARHVQKESFRTHIAAARETGLPLIVHTRDADADMADILENEMENGAFSGVLHCFSSGAELARRALNIGFYISLSGIVTFKNAQDLRNIVEKVPLDRILVETDSPFLAPIPNRGRRNEPSFVVHTAAKVAELKNVSTELLSISSTNNFFRLFNKARRPQVA